MPFVHPDIEASVNEAIARKVIQGEADYYGSFSAEAQETLHVSLVSVLAALNRNGYDYAEPPWLPGVWEPPTPPIDPPIDPPDPDGWGDGVKWNTRPVEDGVLHLNGATNEVIEGKMWKNIPVGSGNSHVCVMLTNCSDITIRNCDFDTIAQPIAVMGGTRIKVEFNRANNITGPSARLGQQNGNFLQTVNGPTEVEVVDNKIKGGDTEDIISGYSAKGMLIARNQIEGAGSGLINGGWTSASGTGFILADGGGSDQIAEYNTLLNPGQVGGAIAGGTNCIMRHNVAYQLSQSPRASSNVGFYVLNYYGEPFGGHTVHNNRAKVWSDGGGVWNGSYIPGTADVYDNNWNDDSIDAEALKVVF